MRQHGVDPGSQEECVQGVGDELDALGHSSRHNRGGRDGKLRESCGCFKVIPSTVTVPTVSWWIMQGVVDARANAFDRDEAAIQARSVAKAAGMIRTTYWKRNVLYLDSSVVDMAKLLVPMKALLMLLPSASSLSP